uniref:DUF3741 domain-containing protein n=1 Tax=Kalanchoe fedtschenkoi TaxID=63787 RepID=A0A7N0V4L4_KALFE
MFYEPVLPDTHGRSMEGRRGARGMAASKTGASKMDGVHKRSSSGSGSFAVENSSKQLVPFSQGRGGNQMGDLLGVLDFAFNNGQKLMMDSSMSRSLLAFLQQISHGSVIDFRNFGRKGNVNGASSSAFQISTFHINEISKGAQKLNNILAACSKGVNGDRYTIEIGKELFRSAKDLEESLRMLVGLQEASSNMTAQRKNRIRLLEGSEEDEDDNTAMLEKQKQITRPRFSFDKQSNSNNAIINQETSKSLRQRSEALAYLAKAHISEANHTVSHRRSFSYGGELSSNTSATEKRTETSLNTLKSEKKGLPNVIAKLMGLEEVPPNEKSKHEIRKEPELKQKDGTTIKMTHGSTASHSENKGVELSSAQMVKARLLQGDKIPIFKGAPFEAPQKKRHENSHPGTAAIQGEKSLAMMERTNKSKIPETKILRSSQHHLVQKGSQEQERKYNFPNERKVRSATNNTPNFSVTSDGVQLHQEEKKILISKEMHNESKFETEKRNSKRTPAEIQQRPQNGFGLGRRILFGQPEKINKMHKLNRTDKKLGKERLHVKNQKISEGVVIASTEVDQDLHTSKKENPQLSNEIQHFQTGEPVSASSEEHSSIIRDPDNPNDNNSCIITTSMATDKDSDHITFSEHHGAEEDSKKRNAPPLKEEKYVLVSTSMSKVPNSKVLKSNSLKMINQTINRNKEQPKSSNRSEEHQSAASKEKETLQDDLSYAKNLADYSSRSSTQPSETTTKPPENQTEKPPALHRPDMRDITDGIASQATGREHAPLCRIANSGEPISCDTQPKEAGINRMSPESEMSHPLQAVGHKTHKTKKSDTLTEEENKLKHIIALNEQFLNTAEALFKLNIPVNILQAGDQECGDKENKDMLDAGVEIMKRKGRKQELAVHPFTKKSISFLKVGSLDDLVKQLYRDFETLKSYGGTWGDDPGAYLLKMVQRDMYYGEPDINCMWDYGWDCSTFSLADKDDTIQQLERYILNDLMDDILENF